MHASNIQMVEYFLTDFNYSTNPDYEETKDAQIKLGDFVVNNDINKLDSEDEEGWVVELKLEFMPPAENNVPYSCAANIVGFFRVHPKVPANKVETYIETNATSVLYSTLREIVSTMTAKGPYPQLLLPTVSFYEKRSKSSVKEDDN